MKSSLKTFAAAGAGVLAALIVYEAWTLYRVERAIDAAAKAFDATVTPALAESRRRADAAAAARAAATRRQRQDSRRGRELERRCAEYGEAARDLESQFAREQRDAACAAWRHYLDTGR